MSRNTYNNFMYKDYEKMCNEVDSLKDKVHDLKASYKYEKREHELTLKRALKAEEQYNELSKEYRALGAEASKLRDEVARLNALLNSDGTNCGLPTSMTPINKKKVIPNSRVKTGKKRGGQLGHQMNKLEAFEDDEITETVIHPAETSCPCCGGELEETGKITTKDEHEYELIEKKIRHVFSECRCAKCGKLVQAEIPQYLKADNQYGSNVQALCLTLMNVGNVPINKVKHIVYGLSEGDMSLSEGYIAKLQKRASVNLKSFIDDAKEYCKRAHVLHWDDTVISINTNRGCLRFYGNEDVALYTAHGKKDKNGVDEDGILSALPATTIVEHDHNTLNYNDEYAFKNAECCAHLMRDLEKMSQTTGHKWASDMKELFASTNVERNAEIEKGSEAFSDERTVEFVTKFDTILLDAYHQCKADNNKYYTADEKALINRLTKYKDNYCMWVMDFSVPFTNNLAERALRGAKTKMKVSGQFFDVRNAQYYANIRTYIETCRRNNVNETEALQRLCQGNPFTLEEVLTHNNDVE